MSTQSEWIHSQGVDFGSKAGGEVWIFVFHNHKQTNKKSPLRPQYYSRQTCDHPNLWMYWWGFAIHHSNFDMDGKKLVHAFVMCVPCNRLGSIPRCSSQYSPRSLCPGIVWWFLWCVSKCLISVICTICKLTVDESVQSKISVGKKEWVQFWLNLILYQDSSGIV